MGFMDQFKDAMQSGMPSSQDMEYMQKVTKLNQSGVEAPATIKRLAPTGRTDAGGGTEYEVEVEVRPADGAPYPATFVQYMHEQTMGSWATEGADVKVRMDPDDRSSMILWGGAA
ncbi:MAG TPA: hypothetical protein VEK39_05435 [Solirubrobacterales bacterium]|nr:hypothetical protein [Solirubrobacterales bacterium]